MDIFGLILVAALFAWNGYIHIKNSAKLAGYATTGFGDCPYATQFGYLGGWPTGIVLIVIAAGLLLGYTLALYAALVFLAITQALFHRDLTEPSNLKHLALIGALIIAVST